MKSNKSYHNFVKTNICNTPTNCIYRAGNKLLQALGYLQCIGGCGRY